MSYNIARRVIQEKEKPTKEPIIDKVSFTKCPMDEREEPTWFKLITTSESP